MKLEDQVMRESGSKENKLKKYLWVLYVSAGIVLGMFILYFTYPTNPLQQYIATRTCDYITMGDFQKAVCRDGTIWNVSPFQP